MRIVKIKRNSVTKLNITNENSNIIVETRKCLANVNKTNESREITENNK